MAIATSDGTNVETKQNEMVAEAHHERWAHWPISWSGIWTGALAAIVAVLLFGLIGVAVGGHLVAPQGRLIDLKKLAFSTLAYSVFASFLSFAIGGYVAGKIAGILRSEPAMLHGAIVWLTAVPLLVVLAGLGAGTSLGAWHAGLATANSANASVFDRPDPLAPGASEEEQSQYKKDMAEYRRQMKEDAPRVAANTALCTVSALLLGLMGSVVGGWMASGEPMNLTYHRTRPATRPDRHVRL